MTEDLDSKAPEVVRGLAEARAESKKNRSLPPVHLWNPPFLGDIDMRIAVDGTWYYLGSPINRKPMVKLFSSILRRDGDQYFLVTPVERVGIKVDDAPFLAVELIKEGQGESQTLCFRTNVDDWVTVGAENPISVETDTTSQEPRPYVHIRRNLYALINRAVFYDLVELGVEENIGSTPYFGVWSAKQFFPIAPAELLHEV